MGFRKHKLLYSLCLMVFFYCLFDGSFSYLVPVVVTQSGYSKTFMGIILGSSSFFGAIFDIWLSKYLKNTDFRRVYLLMFVFCFLAPFFLMRNSIFLFISAMAIWGLYYDLSNFGNLDFVSRKTSPDEHSHSFGLIWMFRALGYSIAPVTIGFIISKSVNINAYIALWIYIAISFCFFIVLVNLSRKNSEIYLEKDVKTKFHPQFVLWRKLGRILFPVLLLTAFFWIYDAFFWTIVPLIDDPFLLTFYTLPPLLTGFFVGRITKKFGKKKTAIFSSLIACLVLLLFFVANTQLEISLVTFVSSIFIAFSVPSLNAAYSDYVQESSSVAKEIEALQDFSTNIGYIVGPFLAGFFADRLGNLRTFSVLGMIGIFITVFAIFLTPRHIKINPNKM